MTTKPATRKKTGLRGRDFLSIDDCSAQEIRSLLALGKAVKARPAAYRRKLDGAMMALIFEKPSLRTRTTFTVGIKQLGGDSLLLTPADINLGKRESVEDVARNLERMVSGIMIRTFAHATCTGLADHASIPVINGLTDREHPCQAMADFMTILETKKSLRALKIAYVGDGNNVAHSLLLAAAKLGAHIALGTPSGYHPDAAIAARSREIAAETGARIELTDDPAEAVRGAGVVYTDTWTSMGQEEEAAARRRVFAPYQVNRALFALADRAAVFMHCLPAHRGEEVTDEIIDSPASVVFQQAENRLHVQKAIMLALLGH